MYISGGENVHPAEVEAAIQRLPGVRAPPPVGVADARWGEVGHAFVEMTAGLTLDIDALNAHLASCLARFKRPQRIEQLDALPLTPSGKVHKVALRLTGRGRKRRSPASGCVGFAVQPNHPVKKRRWVSSPSPKFSGMSSVEAKATFRGICAQAAAWVVKLMLAVRRCAAAGWRGCLAGAVPPAGSDRPAHGQVALSSEFSQRATTTVATALPIRLVSARASDIKRSMPRISARPATGMVGTVARVAAR